MSQNPSIVKSRALSVAMRDFEAISPWRGLLKTTLGVFLFVLSVTLSYQWQDMLVLRLMALVGIGLSVAYTFVTTHDAIHHTLTGWKWFDEIVPRFLSAHILWFHGLYSEMHKIHHHMNGVDPRDPERTMWTTDEYRKAGAFGKFWARHQIFLEVFIGCGIFKIYENFVRLRRIPTVTPTMKKQIGLDLLCILVVQGFWLSVTMERHMGLAFFVSFLAGERIGGGILRLRDHAEHYGVVGHGADYFSHQAVNSRNHANVPWWLSRYLNRLNYHSIHHAFARIPFYRLPEGHEALKSGLPECPLPEGTGYWRTTLHYMKHPVLLVVKETSSRYPELSTIPLKEFLKAS